MFLNNSSNENWFVSSERPRKSTLELFPRRTESTLAEAVYARRKIVWISLKVLKSKHTDNIESTPTRDNSSAVLRKRTRRNWTRQKKRSFFFRWMDYFWQDQTYQISSITILDYWPLNLIYTTGFHNILQFTTNWMRKKEMKEERKRTHKFHWNWIFFCRIAHVTAGTIPKLSGYWHKL